MGRKSRVEIIEERRNGQLTVIDGEPKIINGRSYVLCDCERCGKAALIVLSTFRSGRAKSCGCRKNNLHPQYLFIADLGLREGDRYWRVQCTRCRKIYERPSRYLNNGRACKYCKHWIEYRGKWLSYRELARSHGVHHTNLIKKLRAGMPITEALKKRKAKTFVVDGTAVTVRELAVELTQPTALIRRKLHAGATKRRHFQKWVRLEKNMKEDQN